MLLLLAALLACLLGRLRLSRCSLTEEIQVCPLETAWRLTQEADALSAILSPEVVDEEKVMLWGPKFVDKRSRQEQKQQGPMWLTDHAPMSFIREFNRLKSNLRALSSNQPKNNPGHRSVFLVEPKKTSNVINNVRLVAGPGSTKNHWAEIFIIDDHPESIESGLQSNPFMPPSRWVPRQGKVALDEPNKAAIEEIYLHMVSKAASLESWYIIREVPRNLHMAFPGFSGSFDAICEAILRTHTGISPSRIAESSKRFEEECASLIGPYRSHAGHSSLNPKSTLDRDMIALLTHLGAHNQLSNNILEKEEKEVEEDDEGMTAVDKYEDYLLDQQIKLFMDDVYQVLTTVVTACGSEELLSHNQMDQLLAMANWLFVPTDQSSALKIQMVNAHNKYLKAAVLRGIWSSLRRRVMARLEVVTKEPNARDWVKQVSFLRSLRPRLEDEEMSKQIKRAEGYIAAGVMKEVVQLTKDKSIDEQVSGAADFFFLARYEPLYQYSSQHISQSDEPKSIVTDFHALYEKILSRAVKSLFDQHKVLFRDDRDSSSGRIGPFNEINGRAAWAYLECIKFVPNSRLLGPLKDKLESWLGPELYKLGVAAVERARDEYILVQNWKYLAYALLSEVMHDDHFQVALHVVYARGITLGLSEEFPTLLGNDLSVRDQSMRLIRQGNVDRAQLILNSHLGDSAMDIRVDRIHIMNRWVQLGGPPHHVQNKDIKLWLLYGFDLQEMIAMDSPPGDMNQSQGWKRLSGLLSDDEEDYLAQYQRKHWQSTWRNHRFPEEAPQIWNDPRKVLVKHYLSIKTNHKSNFKRAKKSTKFNSNRRSRFFSSHGERNTQRDPMHLWG